MAASSPSSQVITVGDVVAFLDAFAPKQLAAEWDNVGLLLGDAAAPVERIITCLTVTPEVAAEAVAQRVELIVSHHPILFRAVKRLTTSTVDGRMVLDLLRAGVAVYSPHTAFDNTTGGINDILAARLGLRDVQPLRSGAEARYKIVVFVPDADLSRVADAMFAAGAGHIGKYRDCSFRLAGTGTFFGSEATNPAIGRKGQRQEVAEWRLEVVCPEASLKRVVAALREAHSYEEPAFDVYPLRAGASDAGEGRVGSPASPLPLEALARTVKEQLGTSSLQWCGDLAQPIERVALACGAGGEFLDDALRAKAELFLTGEMRFHDVLRAKANGLALILPGHYATERIGVEELAARLQRQWPALAVWASRAEHDPLTAL